MRSSRKIKQRIANVASVEQLIQAMYMVSSSKLLKSRSQLEGVRPIFTDLEGQIKSMGQKAGAEVNDFYRQREIRNRLYIIFTSDRGLSGGYNSSINKFALSQLKGGDSDKLLVVGSIGSEFFRQQAKNIIRSIVDVADSQVYYGSLTMAEWAAEAYLSGEVDEVYVVFAEFKNVLTHDPVARRMLPLPLSEDRIEDFMLYEPDINSYLDELIPLYLHMFLFRAFFEAHTSEQATRMVSMDAAGKNAEEILEDLTHKYNRLRQAAITEELNEIIGSSTIMRKDD